MHCRSAGQIFLAISKEQSDAFNFTELYEAAKRFNMNYEKKDTEFLMEEIALLPPMASTKEKDNEGELPQNATLLKISKSQFRRWFTKYNRSGKSWSRGT